MEKVLDLKKRIIDICYKHKISHITSYITSVGIIDYIYNLKKDNDIFILSSGHCALAYYVVYNFIFYKDNFTHLTISNVLIGLRVFYN